MVSKTGTESSILFRRAWLLLPEFLLSYEIKAQNDKLLIIGKGKRHWEPKADEPPSGLSVNDKLSKSEDCFFCLKINKVYIINVALLYLYLFVKKNHVIFYHLECICTAVNSIVKKCRAWLKYCKIDDDFARAGTLVSRGHFSSLFGHSWNL